MTDRIFVTGATGTTGRELVHLLDAAGVPVRAGVHSLETGHELASENVEVVEIELADRDSLVDAFEGCTTLYLLTPFVPNMAELTRNAVDAAAEAGIVRIVRHSALGVGMADLTVFGWHQECERVVEESGLAWTYVRPTAFMQNLLAQAESIRDEGRLYSSIGDAGISFVDARDVAAAAASILTGGGHDGEEYHLTGPETLTYADIAAILSAVTGRCVEYVDVPGETMGEAMRGVGMPAELADGMVEVEAWFAEGNAAEVYPDTRDLIGETPRTFETFATDHAAAFRPSREETAGRAPSD